MYLNSVSYNHNKEYYRELLANSCRFMVGSDTRRIITPNGERWYLRMRSNESNGLKKDLKEKKTAIVVRILLARYLGMQF